MQNSTDSFFEEVHYFLTQFSDCVSLKESQGSYYYKIESEKVVVFLYEISLKTTDSQLFIESLRMNGWQVISVWEDVWKTRNEIVKARIAYFFHGSETLAGRLTKVRRIDKPQSDAFLETHHLQGTVKTKFKYGLFLPMRYFRVVKNKSLLGNNFENEPEILVAVATFSAAKTIVRHNESYRSFELVRFANRSGFSVVGGFNKLLYFFIKEQSPDDIMTYADADWSGGEGYQKHGFQFIEKMPPNEFYIHKIDFTRVPANRFNFLPENYIKIYNSGSYKFILDLKNPLEVT